MRIARFKVSNYRSITDGKQLDLKSMSVLVGPNNEGKSNILRALVVGMQAIQTAAHATRGGQPPLGRRPTSVLRYGRQDFQFYDWLRDFPINLQLAKPDGVSVFELELELNEQDRADLQKRTGHNLNDLLKIRVRLGREEAQVKIIKRGPANSAINEKVDTICDLVAQRVRVEYISSERTSSEVMRLVQGQAMAAMRGVLESPEYLEALTKVQKYAEKALGPLERTLQESISALIPSVRGVRVDIPRFQAPVGRSDFEIMIDDGAMTSLSAKGDGIQSLAVIGLMRSIVRRSEDVSYIIAIEEPEAHLHPDAVRRLKSDLQTFADEDQVIITTHSPILVNLEDESANILVEDNVAEPARSLVRVRDSLGVKVSDNMSSATLVVIVEGKHDAAILSVIMSQRSPIIRKAIAQGALRFANSNGSSNILYQCRLQRESVTRLHVICDSDGAGKGVWDKLSKSEEMDPRDITLICKGNMHGSEVEDLFNEETFRDLILEEFDVDIHSVQGVGKRNDFSTRMARYFTQSGRPWDEKVERRLKEAVANFVRSAGGAQTDAEAEPVLASIQRSLEGKL